jgi:hypothetical protein
MNLFTPKAAAKHELLLNKLASGQAQYCRYRKQFYKITANVNTALMVLYSILNTNQWLVL